MKKESLIDIKVLLELYLGLLERYERIKGRCDIEMDAFDFVGDYSYFSRFFKEHKTIGDYDRRLFIDLAIPKLSEFEQLVVDAEKTLG